MSYEDDIARGKQIDKYQTLKSRTATIESSVQTWINDATTFHAETPEDIEKAEIIAIRDSLVNNLRAILGT